METSGTSTDPGLGGSGDGRRRPFPATRSGFVTRDGVRLAYDVWENDDRPTVFLMPTWSIVSSRSWKLQIGYLSRHFRVVTMDGRGSGRSDRPAGTAAYAPDEYVADALAVLDDTEVESAVFVAFSCGVPWTVYLAAHHPERVDGIVALTPVWPGFVLPERTEHRWDVPLDTTEDWAKENRPYWLSGGYDDYLEFFFARLFPEPHSTKQIEDGVGWGREVAPETLADVKQGMGAGWFSGDALTDLAPTLSCPVQVVVGADDRIRPAAAGERLAELTGGRLVVVEGGGHGMHLRHPVLGGRLIKEFVDEVCPTPRRERHVRALRRPKRALYLSSPIGLGHARRDLAIARELRTHHPDLQVDWLAQEPVRRVLADAGESIHPASRWLASESAHIDDECAEHDLHAFQAIRRMDEIMVANFMLFQEAVEEQHYDLVVGDEAWDVDYFLHENPELKRYAFAWMTDFVGWLPMPSGGGREAALTADYNAEMIEQRARFRGLRDRSIFVGNPDDVVPDSFGPGLPDIREWTEENFEFAGYATGFEPVGAEERARLRARLGYGEDDLLCVVTVGGSGVGRPLLERILDAVPLARRLVPELRFLVVCGPRIDPRTLPRRRGVTVRGYVPDLYRHLAACDLAVVQGGLTTCMELTAAQRPFLYVPLQNHFEQNFHVRHRLDQYGAGRCLPYDEARDPGALAEAIAKEVLCDVSYRSVETDGAARAAHLIADLV